MGGTRMIIYINRGYLRERGKNWKSENKRKKNEREREGQSNRLVSVYSNPMMDEVRWRRRPTFWSNRRGKRTFSNAACPIVAMKEANLVTALPPPPIPPSDCLSFFFFPLVLHITVYEIWSYGRPSIHRRSTHTHKKVGGNAHTHKKMRRWGKREVAEGATMGPRGHEMRISTPPTPPTTPKEKKKYIEVKKKTNNMACRVGIIRG